MLSPCPHPTARGAPAPGRAFFTAAAMEKQCRPMHVESAGEQGAELHLCRRKGASMLLDWEAGGSWLDCA